MITLEQWQNRSILEVACLHTDVSYSTDRLVELEQGVILTMHISNNSIVHVQTTSEET